MKLKQFFVVFIFTLLSTSVTFSQSKTLSEITQVKLQNIGPIYENSEVVGYYMFYQTDKIRSKVFGYKIVILDNNLNIISSETIEGPKQLLLISGIYNDDALLLKLYNGQTKEVTLSIRDKNAKEISKTSSKTNLFEKMALTQELEGKNIATYPVKNTGFINIKIVKQKKYGFSISFYPTNGFEKWTYTSDPKSKMIETAGFIYGNSDIMLFSVLRKPSMMSKKVNMSLQLVDSKTGKKISETSLQDSKYELLALNAIKSREDNSVILFGNYFKKGDSQIKGTSLGLFTAKINAAGELSNKQFISWTEDVSRFMDINEKGKVKGAGYIYFHNITMTSDGNIYAVGEQYKKQVLGISTDIVIENLLVFELNSQFELKNVNVVEKGKSRFSMDIKMAQVSAQILGHYMKSVGSFDYEFSHLNKDKSIFSIGYVDYVKVKGKPNKYVFGSIIYSDGKSIVDKIDLMNSKDKKEVKVFPGKTGNIAIFEYHRKKKTMDMRLEKINY